MNRAATVSLSPAEALDAQHEKTLRQFAIAAGVSLVMHALVLIAFVDTDYEMAQLAGGGASFGLSGGGLGDGEDTAPPSEANSAEELTDAAQAELSEAQEIETPSLSKAQSAETAAQSTPKATTNAADAATPQPARPAATQPPSASQRPPASTPPPKASAPSQDAPRQDAPQTSRRSAGSTGRASPSGSQGDTAGGASEAVANSAAPSGGKSNAGTGTGSGSAKTGEGNAARSNYTGLVEAHLRRNRRSNLTGAGSAILKITVGSNGRVESVSIYKSSGSTRFDRQVMRMARLASPYPKPPAGQGPVLIRYNGK